MPGLHINDRQMRLFMRFRHTDTPAAAAAKAGFSTATAYRQEARKAEGLTGKPMTGRTPDYHLKRRSRAAAAGPTRLPEMAIGGPPRCDRQWRC